MTTEPEAIPADVLVSIPRDLAERVTEIANRNEQSIEGDKLAVLLSAPGAKEPSTDWTPLYTHPAPSSPDAEMVKRLGALLEPHVDWEGGPPSRATAAEARASELQREVERLREAIRKAVNILYHNLGRQDEKVRDVEPLLRAALQQEGESDA